MVCEIDISNPEYDTFFSGFEILLLLTEAVGMRTNYASYNSLKKKLIDPRVGEDEKKDVRDIINSDNFFELLLKKKGLSLKMPDNEEEEREAARFYAKALTSKRLDDSIRGRLGVLIDSTSGDVKKTAKIIQKLKQVGYDVKVLFVQTTLEVAKKRNQERPRSVPEKALEFSWKGAQKAKSQLKSIVGSRDYHEIDNNHGDKPDMALAGKLTSWSKRLNTKAQQWINHVRNGQTHGVSEENDINTIIYLSLKMCPIMLKHRINYFINKFNYKT